MFAALSGRLQRTFKGLARQGVLTESGVDQALADVRKALLEADVALPAVRKLIADVREQAVGRDVLKSVSPADQVVKIVHDALVDALGGSDSSPLRIDSPPAVILMVGLQGSGKTTSSAKLARHLQSTKERRVLLAALDTRRPAAMEQLATLGARAEVETLPILPGQTAGEIADRAIDAGRRGGFDIVILDTAGRMAVDDELMAEVADIRDRARPKETLLVVDSLTGQDAVRVAEAFDGKLGVTGVILTRLDGDGRGGAALSMRAAIGKPIRFAGVGENIGDFEPFHPDRIASRIVGMGDIVSLVEKAEANLELDDQRSMRRMERGHFDMNDMRVQFRGMSRLGDMKGLLQHLPGLGKVGGGRMPDMGLSLRRNLAAIDSMTEQERRNPDILQASRKRRIAAGSGIEVSDVNRLLRMHGLVASVIRQSARNGTDPGQSMQEVLQQALSGQAMPRRMAGGRRKRVRLR